MYHWLSFELASRFKLTPDSAAWIASFFMNFRWNSHHKFAAIMLTGNRIGYGFTGILQTLDIPGHAPHHLAIFDPVSQSLFCGEALGHYLPEYRLLYPAVAPPGFDLEISRATIKKFLDRSHPASHTDFICGMIRLLESFLKGLVFR